MRETQPRDCHAQLDEHSHGQVALSDGDVECWLHGSRFDLITGVPTRPPATTPMPVYPTRISSGSVEVALPARTSGTEVVDSDRPAPAGLAPPAPPSVSPRPLPSYRSQLTFVEDVVAPVTWAGSIPQAHGIAFEVDAIDASWGEGWSAVVHGQAELLQSSDVIDPVSGLLAPSRVPVERTHRIRIVPESITGRSIDVGRLGRTDVPRWVQAATPARMNEADDLPR